MAESLGGMAVSVGCMAESLCRMAESLGHMAVSLIAMAVSLAHQAPLAASGGGNTHPEPRRVVSRCPALLLACPRGPD